MAAQSLLAKLGMRLSTLGSAASLAIAFPLTEGDPSMGAHTDAGRIGLYAGRTPGAEKVGTVVMGTEVLTAGVAQVSIPLTATPTTSTDGAFVVGNGVASSSVSAGNGRIYAGTSVSTPIVVMGEVAGATARQIIGGYDSLGTALYSIQAVRQAIGFQVLSLNPAGAGVTTGPGLMAAGSTDGFIYITRVSAAPSANPVVTTHSALTVDAATNTLYLYSGGAWHAVGSGGGGITGSLTSGRVVVASGAATVTDFSTLTYTTTDGLSSNRSGTRNEMFGFGCGTSTMSGSDNTLVGYQCGDALTTGSRNTAMAATALTTCLTGNDNAAYGWNALNAYTGSECTAFGSEALALLTTAARVVAVGYLACSNAQTGASDCVAIGHKALWLNSSVEITAIGSGCLDANISSTGHTAVGFNALGAITAGNNCTAVGHSALAAATGGNNTAVGYQAADAITSATNIVAIGTSALGNPTTGGGSSTAVGYQALLNVTIGNNNTAVGAQAGLSITSGANNVCIGALANVSATVSNSISIGNGSTCSASSSMAFGVDAASTASNTMVVGSSTNPINAVYIGEGIRSASPSALVLGATGGLGTDISAASFTIAGGAGTGTGAAGVISFTTAPPGSTGTTLNTQVECARFDASTTAGDTRFLLYDVDNGTLERVTVGAADSGGSGFKLLRIPN